MKWYIATGAENDVVVSSRIRLARNLKNYPFVNRMDETGVRACTKTVFDAAQKSGNPLVSNLSFIEMDSLSDTDAAVLLERHLISPEFANERGGRGLILRESDDAVSIMVGEEDHIRIQVMRPGLALDDAYHEAEAIDNLFDQNLTYAFNGKLGFLTQCPTNLGTGLRASVMLHLPALERSGALNKLASTLPKLGLTIRGTYGEGTKAQGAFYQLSNQVTLGISEKTAIDNLKGITTQIIAQERAARDILAKQPAALEDSVFRALGTLQNARLLSGAEFLSEFSLVRLGVSMGLIQTVSLETLGALLADCTAAALIQKAGHALSEEERDIARATAVRSALA